MITWLAIAWVGTVLVFYYAGNWPYYLEKVSVFGIGLIRLDAWSMGGLAVAATILAGLGLRAAPFSVWSAALVREARQLAHDRVGLTLWLALGVVGLSSLLQGLAPPNDYDGLMYHLPLALHDVELGRIEPYWALAEFVFFPQLLGNLYRLFMALGLADATQMIHGLFGLVAAAFTAALTRRLGGTKEEGLLAALMLLILRVVIWEMGTAEVDIATAAFTIAALLSCLTWLQSGSWRSAILTGLMLGAGSCVKFNGLVVALTMDPLALAPAWRRLGMLVQGITIAAAALVFSPHALWAWSNSGNPVFPLFNRFFNPDQIQLIEGAGQLYGYQRTVANSFPACGGSSSIPRSPSTARSSGPPICWPLRPWRSCRVFNAGNGGRFWCFSGPST
ncbi:glycosyltransferase family 39 protein [Magnetospirillum sp. 15-1]|uniref:glycosyltransferase family 39 protein n=1 Tax=Magnetospirillum sp. 15-1 TaxID=1979370 RepID=UPI000BBBAD5B|nr:glycosyltransferase family 39 protein [Magnetospirillum sp. 15-1]